MHLYAPSNHVQNLRNEVIHIYIETSILSGRKKEICICIKIRSLVISHRTSRFPEGEVLCRDECGCHDRCIHSVIYRYVSTNSNITYCFVLRVYVTQLVLTMQVVEGSQV
jgi:hypothetical protein